MELIDTHIHLYADDFAHDLPELLKEANKRDVSRFFLPAIDSEYTQRMLELKAKYPDTVALMAGVHPTHVNDNIDHELERVRTELEKRCYVAVGEIGVDLYWDTQFKAQQISAFETQIQWAHEFELPIVIHCRDAFQEVFETLERMRGMGCTIRGILHCFTGTLEDAKRAIGLGLHLGIGGVVTFKHGKIDQFLSQIDLSHIVLETDGPYLAPTPFRGKRNQPAYLRIIAEKVSELYALPLDEIARITSANAVRIFGWK